MNTPSDSSDDDNNPPPIKRKRGIRKVDKYKRNIIRNAKVKGVPHQNWKGKDVPGRNVGINCSCRQGCLVDATDEDAMQMMQTFNAMCNKDAQDLHLQRLIEIQPVERRRPKDTTDLKKPKTFTANYFVLCKTFRLQVCKTAFLQAHGVTKKRVERLINLLQQGKTPVDRRGRNISGNSISGEICQQIFDHISSFPVKKSHYTGRDIEYLDARLSVKMMFDMFKEKYPDSNVKYQFYWQYFKANFNFRFGRPQKDTCTKCEELKVKVKSPSLSDSAKKTYIAELMIHNRRSKKFYSALKQSTELCKSDKSVLSLCFDYMATVSLPHIPIQDIYYYRQLSVSTFGIHNMSNGHMTCYVYHEGTAKKSPDEVCSFINHYIENYVEEEVTELHLFSDNCPGQNKNNTVVRFCMALLETKRFKIIKQYFPIRGHSFLPCDRDFGLIKRVLKKADRLYTLDEFCEIISKASVQKNKFSIVKVETEEIINFKNWWPVLFKKNCNSEETMSSSIPRQEKESFTISKFNYFEHNADKPGFVLCSQFIGGLILKSFKLRPSDRKTACALPCTRAYSGKIPILKSKMNDLLKIKSSIPEEVSFFWNEIFNLPTD